MIDEIKTIRIEEDVYYKNLESSYWYDGDNSCFGKDIDGRFYLYSDNGVDEYHLTIFNQDLQGLLCNSFFVAKLASEVLKRNPDVSCDFCTFISDCINGDFCFQRMPFELHDIVYAII